jgi:putative pyruvate formate lyase activating enzyme
MTHAGNRLATVPVEVHGHGRFVVASGDFVPAYIKTHEQGGFKAKVDEAKAMLGECTVCPRDCRVDRWADQRATCATGRHARVSSASPHHGEEDCLRGWRGSGTIFFAGCNLRCAFCQNFEISQLDEGQEVTPERLADLMIRLQGLGCHNINFVTPEHVVPQILEALPLAIDRGLHIPLVYNTGGYDSLDSIRLMDGIVDLYMPDFKLWDAGRSLHYLGARDYADAARAAIAAMHRQVGELQVDEQGIAVRGVLIRHLVMPGLLDETRQIMRWLATELSPDTFVNVMDQYHPAWKARTDARYAAINCPLDVREYAEAVTIARQAGLWRFDTRWAQTS